MAEDRMTRWLAPIGFLALAFGILWFVTSLGDTLTLNQRLPGYVAKYARQDVQNPSYQNLFGAGWRLHEDLYYHRSQRGIYAGLWGVVAGILLLVWCREHRRHIDRALGQPPDAATRKRRTGLMMGAAGIVFIVAGLVWFAGAIIYASQGRQEREDFATAYAGSHEEIARDPQCLALFDEAQGLTLDLAAARKWTAMLIGLAVAGQGAILLLWGRDRHRTPTCGTDGSMAGAKS